MKTLVTTTIAFAMTLVIGVPTNAQMGGVDTRYVADNSFFVIQFDMQKLFSYEKMGSKNLETIAGFLKREINMDLMTMETLTFQLSEGEDASTFDEDSIGVVMTFSRPVDKAKFLESMKGIDFEEAEFNGIKYQKSSRDYAPSICFGDGKTIIMGADNAMRAMIGKKSGNSRVHGLLNSADPNAEVKAAFVGNEMYKNMLSEIAREIPIKPFNIEKVFGEAKSAIISGNVKSSTPIYVQVDCNSEEGAETLAEKIKLLIDLGKASIPIGKEAMESEKKNLADRGIEGFRKFQEIQIDMAIKALGIGEKILEGASTSSEGKKATIKVKMMGGFKQYMPLVAELFGNQFKAMDELRREFEKEVPEAAIEEAFERAVDKAERAK